MVFPIHDPHGIEKFFEAIKPFREGYSDIDFRYIALRRKDIFIIAQASLVFNTGPNQIPQDQFISENVRCGSYPISELNSDPEKIIKDLLSGKISTPHGDLHFLPPDNGGYATSFEPFHLVGLQAQNRFNSVSIRGTGINDVLQQPYIDWELKAAVTPFDNLQELMWEYKLGNSRGEIASIEIVALNVAVIDFNSKIKDEDANVSLRVAKKLNTTDITLGYRMFSQGKIIARTRLSGNDLKWTDAGDYQSGIADIKIPKGAVLHCFVSYKGVTQHFGWLSDPSTAQNPRRSVYEGFDGKLDILKDLISRRGRGQAAREFEAGVAWLLWLLGFNVIHLGATPKTQDAADLIATTPNGNIAVVECTTGQLKADNKLSLLIERAEGVRRQLVASNYNHLRVLPTIVTSMARNEVKADLEQAEKLGVLVMTRENLDHAINRTLLVPQADQLFDEAEQNVRSAQAKYMTENQ